ncbi:MAG: nickel-dependent lactate racemase [Nitrososphaerota archaeon]|nr:nickel-dependent lactate racemase [Candidatus Bathyarchaeota archaeon]MDW8048149.1 nickel-dependent lactate racemase [Nitrososphaerota archaeon]
MVEVWLPYGKTEVCVRVETKNLLNVIEPQERTVVGDVQSEIERSLTNPIDSQPLVEIAKSSASASILLEDMGTSLNSLIVSPVLKALNSAGLGNENVSIVVSCDLFRVHPPEGGTRILSDEILSTTKVLLHTPGAGEYINIGKTSRGTPVNVEKRIVEADLKIVIGSVKPHAFFGYGGPMTSATLGILSLDSIHQNLMLSLDSEVGNGVCIGNPVFDDAVEASGKIGADFAMNIVVNRRSELIGVFSGDAHKSFMEAVNFVEETCKSPIDTLAEVTFISPGGFPLDATLQESSLCLDNAVKATKMGKTIVLVAECSMGLGSKEFREAIKGFSDVKTLEKKLRKKPNVAGLMVHHMAMVLGAMKNAIIVSILPNYCIPESLNIELARTANEGLRKALEFGGGNSKVSLIPFGNMTIPEAKISE